MAKAVKITTRVAPFPTQKAALVFFDSIKDKYAAGEHLDDTDTQHVRAIFEEYCRVTKWPIPPNIQGFMVDNKAEEISPGEFRTHKCFWYQLSDKTRSEFSMIKAIQSISRDQNS